MLASGMAEPTGPRRDREFRWLMAVIGLALLLGVAVLLIVVLFQRSGQIRGHPSSSPSAALASTISL
jgi:hypothetical protein